MSTCRFCGFKSHAMTRTKNGWHCKSDIACFNRLLAIIDRLKAYRAIGAAMANACYNLAQGQTLHPADRDVLSKLRKQWDEV